MLLLDLLAQADTTVSGGYVPTTSLGTILAAVLTPIVAWVSTKIYDGFKTILPFYDKLPAVIHQALAPLVGFGFGWLTATFALPAVLDLHGVTAGFVGGLSNALLMAGIKRFEKAQHPTDTTKVVEASRESGSTPDPRSTLR